MTKKLTRPLKKRGPKGHKPTDFSRGNVRGLVIAGFPHAEIADYIGISTPTLVKCYEKELRCSLKDLLKSATESLGVLVRGAPAVYDKAGNCLRAEIPRTLGPIAFALKTKGKRFGWSERFEISGPDGGPILTKDATKAAISAEVASLIAEHFTVQETAAQENQDGEIDYLGPEAAEK